MADGNGDPNQEGIDYYNSLIDALLEKGHTQIISSHSLKKKRTNSSSGLIWIYKIATELNYYCNGFA